MSLLQAISLKKITSWSFLITAYSFLFPFSLAVANIFLALFVVRWIADLYLGKVTCRKATIIDIIVYTLFFVTISLSVFYSLDKETGIKFVYRNLPLLFFPILLFTIILKNKSQIIFNSSLFFSIALFIINLFSLTGATINWFLSTNNEMGFLHNISLNKFSSAFINYDYLYLGLYTSFALLISSCLLISKKSKPWHKKFGYVSIPFFFISLFLIGGRNSILTSILIGTALMVYYGVTYKKIKFLTICLFLVSVIFYINISYNDYFKERVGELINYNNAYTLDDHWGGRAVRLKIWDCAYNIYSSRPVTGVGLGDTGFMLNHCYHENNISALIHFNKKYNAHNQYLQALLEAGILGLASLLIFLLYPLFRSLKNRNYIHILFLLVIISFIATETIFHRNSGILFFGFFHTLLYLNNRKE